jgi:S-DNA-T family DNA segregation ATPase FtsK/SpoIIIE
VGFILQIAILSGLMLLWALLGLGLFTWLRRWVEQQAALAQREARGEVEGDEAVSVAPIGGQAAGGANARKKRLRLPVGYKQKFQVPDEEAAKETTSPPPGRDDRLPPIELLVHEQSSRPDERTINETAYIIEKTLAEFGIPAKVVGFRVGPTVTQFAVEPGFVEKGAGNEGEANRQKVRVSQISALSRDLALALSAERLRIEAPVPGRPYVGIEVPNMRSTVVRLRPILESDVFYKVNSPLAIALGRDVSGQPVIADLERMPHLLIAGTTGSGKSVCIAALTTCLVMNNTPEDLRLIMIDPKMVELVRFNGLPHLLGKVETELTRILGVLRWTMREMDRRYKLFEAHGARNLDTYHEKINKRGRAEAAARPLERLPRIVVFIDELADLMMQAPDETERMIVRLAQMARATGIHLVVATQRPSTDVVTGLIKANFPARIAFAVPSSIESRVILDTPGAESLLGRGDMLYLSPEAGAPIRLQGCFVTDREITGLIDFWKGQPGVESAEAPEPARLRPSSAASALPDGLDAAPWEGMVGGSDSGEEDAEEAEIEEAVRIIRESGRASASLLQRKMRLGYPKAARLMDELHRRGVIGRQQAGGKTREVLRRGGDAQDEENADGE